MGETTPGSAPVKCADAPAPAAAGQGQVLQAMPGEVKVRMYRQGLGDCFLLAFPTSQPPQSYYVLIDCGVFLGLPCSGNVLDQVANDIAAATGGHIHLLVVSHRHWDHIAGFNQSKEIFGKMTVHNLWLPWLEDPDDPYGKAHWQRHAQALAALKAAVDSQPAALTHVNEVLGFAGDLGAAAKDTDPLVNVRQWFKDSQARLQRGEQEPCYCRPGEGPLKLPAVSDEWDVPSAQVFVLGPPLKEDQLGQMDNAPGGQETYLTSLNLLSQLAFAFGLSLDDGADDDGASSLRYPFADRLRIPTDEAKKIDFFRANYGFDELPAAAPTQTGPASPATPTGASSATTTATMASASDAGSSPAGAGTSAPGEGTGGLGMDTAASPGAQSPSTASGKKPKPCTAAGSDDSADADPMRRRRIEDVNQAPAEGLALQLDSVVNNTSLVLAIELTNSGKVLLFVGDAQVGNWVSWDGLTFPHGAGSTITSAQLLNRTVLYKVGHHGSQNATLRQIVADNGKAVKDWGLSLMTSPELVAMLPLDQVFANAEPRNWRMPWDNMMTQLIKQTQGRILRVDNGVPNKPDGVDPQVWQDFVSQVQPFPAESYPDSVNDPDCPGRVMRGQAALLKIPYIEFTVKDERSAGS